ncbi:hypothetical protein Tco_0781991 [Tanacetum coccineum]
MLRVEKVDLDGYWAGQWVRSCTKPSDDIDSLHKQRQLVLIAISYDSDVGSEDLAEDEHQLNPVRDWVKSYHLDKVEVTDARSAYHSICLLGVLDIMEKLVDEGTLVRAGKDIFSINCGGLRNGIEISRAVTAEENPSS